MAPKTLTAKKYAIDFGSEYCERHKDYHPCQLEVQYENHNQNVITDYEFGCGGGVVRSDQTVGEAIEWLKNLSRQWDEFEGSIWLIIGGLEQHREQ